MNEREIEAIDRLRRERLLDAAIARASTLIAQAPRDVRAAAILVEVLLDARRFEDAAGALARAVALDPTFAPLDALAGNLALATGRAAVAVAAYRRALATLGGHAELHWRLGLALHGAGDAAAARDALEQAAALAPLWPQPRVDLGKLAHHARDGATAVAHYHRAVLIAGCPPEVWKLLGDVHADHGTRDDALDAYRRYLAVAGDSRDVRASIALGLDRINAPLTDRLPALVALVATAGSAANHTRLGLALAENSDFGAARRAFERALAVDPEFLPARWAHFQYPPAAVHANADAVMRFREDWDAGFAAFAAAARARAPTEVVTAIGVASNFYRHYADDDLLATQRRYAGVHGAALRSLAPPPASSARADDGRVRIAIYSTHFFDHTILRLFGPMLGALDPTRFDIAVWHGGRSDTATAAFAARVERFAAIAASPERVIGAIAAFAPDVLLLPDVGMDPISQLLAAYRIAPLQAMLWGHPVTSGSAAIDVFLSSEAMEPADGDSHYSERLVRLPGIGCRFESPDVASVRPRGFPDAASDRIEIGFVQSAPKNLPIHDEAFARIAAQVPGARFHLTPSNNAEVSRQVRARLATALTAGGLDPARHTGLVRGLPRAEFFGLGHALDFALDSIGWSGGNTALEMLWCDLPIITLPGRTMRTRHTMAMLRLIGLDELVARDFDHYIELAAALAADRPRIAALKRHIGERKHVLYDDRRVDAALAGFLEREGRAARVRRAG